VWERPLAATSVGAWVRMTGKKSGRIRGPSVPVTPVPDQVRNDGPGVHFDRLKVAGDIFPFRKFFRRLVPMNMDSCFRRNDGKRPNRRSGLVMVKPGMTEWSRTNPGIAATSRSHRGMIGASSVGAASGRD
jgi:hypothetical protein